MSNPLVETDFIKKEEIRKSIVFRDILIKLINTWKSIEIHKNFYETDNPRAEFEKNVERLVQKYPTFTKNLLDTIANCLSKDKSINLIQFLLEIGTAEIGDENKLYLIQYLFQKFEVTKEIKTKEMVLLLNEMRPKEDKLWFEYIKFLSDFIDMDILFEPKSYYASYPQRKLKYTFEKFIEIYRKVNLIEKENQEMRKRIEELELQVKYMPGSDGYLEAKEHFEILSKK